jgi:hypothetical protein
MLFLLRQLKITVIAKIVTARTPPIVDVSLIKAALVRIVLVEITAAVDVRL